MRDTHFVFSDYRKLLLFKYSAFVLRLPRDRDTVAVVRDELSIFEQNPGAVSRDLQASFQRRLGFRHVIRLQIRSPVMVVTIATSADIVTAVTLERTIFSAGVTFIRKRNENSVARS